MSGAACARLETKAIGATPKSTTAGSRWGVEGCKVGARPRQNGGLRMGVAEHVVKTGRRRLEDSWGLRPRKVVKLGQSTEA